MAIADLEFTVIPEKDRAKLKKVGTNRYSNRPNPLVDALVEGQTIIVNVEDGKKIAGLYEQARRRDMKLTANKIFLPDEEGKPTDKPGYMLYFTPLEGAN